MLKLDAYEICPIARTCEYRIDVIEGNCLCGGCNPTRETMFVCDLYIPKDSIMSIISECLKETNREDNIQA